MIRPKPNKDFDPPTLGPFPPAQFNSVSVNFGCSKVNNDSSVAAGSGFVLAKKEGVLKDQIDRVIDLMMADGTYYLIAEA
ncbi:MAG: ABC-type amino acid transport substrate-binding protein [Psychromonas sp.]|jgi:ABC-type amino acid transport substrate-binding protein|uniref:hypothetical protein n=1 Tax=Psychromonas sp. TaxID=1884585 RepID=UPI0039E32563